MRPLLPESAYMPGLSRKRYKSVTPPHARLERKHYIYRLEVTGARFTADDKLLALPGLSCTDHLMWYRVRRRATEVQERIRREGGRMLIHKFPAHLCKRCKTWLLGAMGENVRRQRERERMHDLPAGPCGPGCVEVKTTKRTH